jgi:hypothetical protein
MESSGQGRGRPRVGVVLSASECEKLERWARRPTTANALASNTRISLLSASRGSWSGCGDRPPVPLPCLLRRAPDPRAPSRRCRARGREPSIATLRPAARSLAASTLNRRSGMALEASGAPAEPGAMHADAALSLRREYRCADCGYSISTFGRLPACPMFHAHDWEPGDWRSAAPSALPGSERRHGARTTST